MTIGTDNAYSGPYLANGSTTVFPFTFEVLDPDWVSVLVRDSEGADTIVSPSLYSVSLTGNAPSAGSVSLSVAPGSGLSVYVYLDPAFDQTIGFENGSAWTAKPVNDGYDASAQRDQVLRRDLDRALLAPIGETPGRMPTAAERAGKYLAFDVSGDPTSASGTGSDPDLRSDLAATAGAGLLGLDQSAAYPHGSLGAWVKTSRPYNATADILKARALGATDDAVILNTILASYNSIVISPAVGSLALKTTVYALLGSTKIVMEGGLQAAPWVRDTAHTGSTLVCGNAGGSGCGSIHLENIWFVHPGRIGATPGVALPNRLTGGQSHLEIHGVQNGYAKIGGYGMPYFASVFGGAGMLFDQPFTFGGVWDNNFTAAQEAIAQFRFTYSAQHGHGTNHTLRTPHLYGCKSMTKRNIVVGSKTVQAVSIIGPRYGLLVESCEDWEVDGGFMAQFSSYNVAYIPVAGGIAQNGIIRGCKLDESNEGQFYATRASTSLEALDTMTVIGCLLNGQFVSKYAVAIDGGLTDRPVKRFNMIDCVTRAHLAGPVRLIGLDGGRIAGNRFAGYNAAINDTSIGNSNIGAGILIDGATRNTVVEHNTFGGGANGDTETNSANADGVSSNATQWGIIDATTNANNVSKDNRIVNFGLGGGAISLGQNVVPVAVTVGASPFTYTAGARDEVLYIRGGTVSNVTQGGVSVFTATGCTVHLAAGESAVITYSSAPTILKKAL